MNTGIKSLPITVKRSIELMGLFLFGALIVLGNTIIMPLLMAFFFSLVLLPVFRFFRKLRVPEALAIFLPILLLTVFLGLIIWLFTNLYGARGRLCLKQKTKIQQINLAS